MLKWNVFIVLSIIICTCSSDNIGDYEDPAVCRLVQNGSEIEKIEVGKDRQTVLLTLYASSSWSLTCDANGVSYQINLVKQLWIILVRYQLR